MNSIDVVMATYNRRNFTEKTIQYLNNRTLYPYRLFVVDNASTDGTSELLKELSQKGAIYKWIRFNENVGIHMAWNIGVSMTDSQYFITTDNDILVPELSPDWLEQLLTIMKHREEYGAIALQPHIFIGAAQVPIDCQDEVIERNMCGAVMRMFNRQAYNKTKGWARDYDRLRNNEEKHICSQIINAGYKVGYTGWIRAFHLFGDDQTDPWGYEKEATPESHGHRDVWPPVNVYGKLEKYDNKTWFPLK